MPQTRDILYFDVCLVYLVVCLIDYRSVNIVVVVVTGYSTKIYSVCCTI